jgi:hypothetical protein
VRQCLVGHRPQQVGQPDEGEPGLGCVADALQDKVTVGLRDLDQRSPDRGLHDPGRALDDQRMCQAGGQERPACLEFPISPVKRYIHC